MVKISVIVPVYNVEKYLERCMSSLLNQTFDDYEILLVDDGSTDSCSAICEKYIDNERVKVFHKQNGGLSDARNYGLERASGKYVTYIDSDDYVSKDYLKYLYDLIQKENADMSCCGYVRTDNSNEQFNLNNDAYQVCDGKEACSKMLIDLDFKLVVAWAKLIKREIAQKYLFPKGRLHEDVATTFNYYLESKKVVIGERNLYGYFINYQGIQLGNISLKRREDEMWAAFYRADVIRKDKDEYLYGLAIKVALIHLKEVIKSDIENRKHWEKYYNKVMKDDAVKVADKIKLGLIMNAPFILKIYHKIKAN